MMQWERYGYRNERSLTGRESVRLSFFRKHPSPELAGKDGITDDR